jgi:hypothetical protein
MGDLVIATATLLAAMLSAAPGDLYRCRTPDGRTAFQDRPCAQGQGARLRAPADGGQMSPQALREWLRGLGDPRPVPAAARAPRGAATAYFVQLDERTLAGCSAIFLDCADQRRGSMDVCVSRAPRCHSAGGESCCPAETLANYSRLRRAGSGFSAATRSALLGE